MHLKKWAWVFTLLAALLTFVACSSSDDIVVSRYDGDGNEFSPTELKGSIEYLPSMKAVNMKVVRVDEQLNPLDTFNVIIDSSENQIYYWKPYEFVSFSRDYEYPYVKILIEFPAENNGKNMEFAQYVRLFGYNGSIKLQFYGALVANRIETLVREKKMGFKEAEGHAYQELSKALHLKVNDFYHREYKGWDGGIFDNGDLNDLAPFVYCRHEISDSVFYSDYMEFRESFGKNGTVDNSMLVRAADAWLSTFEKSTSDSAFHIKSVSRDTVNNLITTDDDFFEWAYGLNCSWYSEDPIKITNEKSAYYGRSFIHDYAQNPQSKVYVYRWRLGSVLEDSIGACTVWESNYAEYEGDSYVCKRDLRLWKKETNSDTLLIYKYGKCVDREYRKDKIVNIGGFKFICSCASEDDCAWKEME